MRYLLSFLILFITLLGCTQPSPPASKPEPTPVTAPAASTVTEPAPAKPVISTPPPQPSEKPTSFESEKYVNSTYGFSIRYPNNWISWKPPLKTIVFFASEKIQQPDRMAVAVDVRPADDFKVASKNLVFELVDWKSNQGTYVPLIELVSEKTIQLADGNTTAFDQCWAVANYRIYCCGILKDGNAITVVAGWDEANENLYHEIVQTLTLTK